MGKKGYKAANALVWRQPRFMRGATYQIKPVHVSMYSTPFHALQKPIRR